MSMALNGQWLCPGDQPSRKKTPLDLRKSEVSYCAIHPSISPLPSLSSVSQLEFVSCLYRKVLKYFKEKGKRNEKAMKIFFEREGSKCMGFPTGKGECSLS